MKNSEKYELKREWQVVADDFMEIYGDSGCTCFLSPPCGYCTHEGNPNNLEESDDAWAKSPADMEVEAVAYLAWVIKSMVLQHSQEGRLLKEERAERQAAEDAYWRERIANL